MKFLDDMKLSLKLGVLIFIAIISLSVIGYTGYYFLQQAKVNMNTMYTDRLIPVRLGNEVRTNMAIGNAATLELIVTTDNKRHQELQKILETIGKQTNANNAELNKLNLDSKGKDLLAKVEQLRATYRDTRKQVIDLAIQNNKAEAYTLYVTKMNPLAIEFMNRLREFADYHATLAEKTNVYKLN